MMSNTGFQFDSHQQYQLDAINAVADLFDGQPKDAGMLDITLRGVVTAKESVHAELAVDTAQEVGAIGNMLVLDNATVLANLQTVQDRNGLEVRDALAEDALDFDIEMETGTGKTYVYLRTIFELARRYSFGKFIILVPSVAIREGVNTSIRLMHEHFRGLYPSHPFDASVYSGDRAEEVQAFATATSVQIMVMTIDAVRGDKNTRIIHQQRDKLNGLRPIDYLKATRPVVIMDEPQNMESLLSQSAVSELDPVFTLRYSATHKRQRNLVYRLDPVDAHDLGLVKQIVVAEVVQQGADATPYIKLLEVKHAKAWTAKLELSCRKADGSLERIPKAVKSHQELSKVSGNPAYEGWRINEMRIADGAEPASIELTNYGVLTEGESIGGATGAIYKEMIRETVREHLRKEAMLRAKGIKVLSLFFVDKVSSFLGDGVNNDDADGDFVKWFDEVFIEERGKDKRYSALLPQEPRELRRAYFSQLKAKGKTSFVDSSGTTAKDDDAYELIMQDKQRLLDADEPVRFIFSHSALREGWDNPNVFQICTLREIGAETERRQTLGRGMRLPVAKTDKGYERVADRGIATLTVVANESYQAFAQSLQNEYKAAGVAIGQVRPNEFAKLPRRDAGGALTDEICGYQWSLEVFKHLESQGFIKEGKATSKFLPDTEGFSLNLPGQFQPYEADIIALVRDTSIEKYVKPKSNRQARKFNKALYATPEFEAFWNAISQKTMYRVQVEREKLIVNAVAVIKQAPKIQPLRIEVTRAGVKVLRGGTQGQELGTRTAELKGSYDLPDIIGELQQSTSLTRKTLAEILVSSGKLAEFIGNPNDFIAMVQRSVKGELAKIVVEGIQYEKIGGSIYELRELQADGLEEKERFCDQMYKVQNQSKTDFDYVVYDSGVELEFSKLLDSREDIKLFMKLPSKFKIDTPVGPYNPDWAIIKHIDGEDRIYMIRETKSTQDDDKLRPSELAKIKSARKHFAEIGVGYERSTPAGWNL
ncbi:DEAD/DEAH box helicase family protein [Ferrovum myxofaciens]|uniref:restriction endonuclease n=1 Tax=Ferrovum myxofaciens TaxID=416213 RepID=UPI00235637CD|nr:DEAD/DEAH box helicase family protein [Ferrovum myxofaciens]MBU6994261.1 DEAD/DEAH box helicase family protein [Ferrovum myxofaciens]